MFCPSKKDVISTCDFNNEHQDKHNKHIVTEVLPCPIIARPQRALYDALFDYIFLNVSAGDE